MNSKNELCARKLLDTVPPVMRFIRGKARKGRENLALPQFRTLIYLRRTQGSSLSALAGYLGLSLPATSRMADGLVKRGLVHRQTGSTNRRQVLLTITTEGATTLEKVRGAIRLQLSGALQALTDEQLTLVSDAMEILKLVFDSNEILSQPLEPLEPMEDDEHN